MLITFTCEGSSDITMFADVGLQLLRLMGYADQRSGSISPQEAKQVLERLNTALSAQNAQSKATSTTSGQNDDGFSEAPVSLKARALPLMELLSFAVKKEHAVSWKAS